MPNFEFTMPDYEYKNLEEKIVKINELPLDVRFLILIKLPLDRFILVCDMLEINLDDKISFVMQNYTLEDYRRISYNKEEKIKYIYDKIKERVFRIEMDDDENQNNLRLLSKKYNAIENAKGSKILKFANKNNINIYWCSFNTGFRQHVNMVKLKRTLQNAKFLNSVTFHNFSNSFSLHEDSKDRVLPTHIRCLKLPEYTYNISLDGILPNNLEILNLAYDYNHSIDNLPNNLKILTIGRHFGQASPTSPEPTINKLPKYLEELIFSYDSLYNKHINKQIFDNLNNLTHLTLGGNYNQSIDGILPQTLKYLKLSEKFNQSINNLPNNLEILEINNNYNQPIDNLPSSLVKLIYNPKIILNCQMFNNLTNLTHLIFGTSFNFPVEDIFNFQNISQNTFHDESKKQLEKNRFEKLKYLEFGNNYDNLVDHLPENLETLIFGDNFNQPINNLPKKLKKLILGYKFNQNLNKYSSINKVAYTIKYITSKFVEIDEKYDGVLPKTLEYLHLGGYNITNLDSILPENLKYLSLGGEYNHSLDYLPAKLEILNIGYKFNQPLDHLPNNLSKLIFNFNATFNQPLNNLPDNLKTLTLGPKYTHSLDNLPSKLIELNFDHISSFNCPLIKLPKSLQILRLGNKFNHNIDNFSLQGINLKEIKFGYMFNQSIDNLPDSITKITFMSGKFDQHILVRKLPNLHTLNIHPSYVFIKSLKSSLPTNIILNQSIDFSNV